MSTMKALIKEEFTSGFRLTDAPLPEVSDTDVLIRVLRTGICGTDLHIESGDAWAQKTILLPLIPGHEFCGEIVEVGAKVTTLNIGDLVSGEGHTVCGLCRNCRAGRRHLCKNTQSIGVNRHGAFAEFVSIPESNVWKHSPDIDKNLAAIFDPLGNAVHTALTFPIVGEDVLITGAGPIGLMAIKIARHIGARYIVITDIKESRLELARAMGADLAINPDTKTLKAAQGELGMKEGFDVAWEMSGHKDALPQIIENMGPGGRIALLGLPTTSIDIDWNKVVTHMLSIKGIYGREMYETWYAMTAMVKTGLDVREVISEVVPAREWQRAFDTARKAEAGKIIIDWTDV
ncbi:MAG: hypothetical protein RIS09_405 [Actinomycetota bacterium]